MVSGTVIGTPGTAYISSFEMQSGDTLCPRFYVVRIGVACVILLLYYELMNYKKNALIALIFSAVTLLVILIAIFVWQNKTHVGVKLSLDSISPAIIDEAEWKLYENTKYGYRFKYPPEGNVHDDGGMTDVKESSDLVLSMPDEGSIFEVFVWVSSVSSQTGNEFGRLFDLPLYSFAGIIHKYQTKDNNPHFPDKKVGDLEYITFKEKIAYQFMLTDSFSDGPSGGGYSFSGGTHNYILLENNGAKFVIHYPIENRLSKKLLDSFEFIQ